MMKIPPTHPKVAAMLCDASAADSSTQVAAAIRESTDGARGRVRYLKLLTVLDEMACGAKGVLNDKLEWTEGTVRRGFSRCEC